MSHPQRRRSAGGRVPASCGLVAIAMLLNSCGAVAPAAGPPSKTPAGQGANTPPKILLGTDPLTTFSIAPRHGYIDRTGKMVLKLEGYSQLRDFSEGRAAVRLAGPVTRKSPPKWGFIDKTGKIVVATQYACVRDFSDGLAAVNVGGKWGYIDPTGKVVIEPKFTEAYGFNSSRARITIGQTSGYIDKAGKLIITGKAKEFIRDFSEERVAFQTQERNKWQRNWGYMDTMGKIVIKPRFDKAHDFSGGLAQVHDGQDWLIDVWGLVVEALPDGPKRELHDGLKVFFHDQGLFGYRNAADETIIAPRFTEAHRFHEGIARVTIDGYVPDDDDMRAQRFIDTQGRFITADAFDETGPFSEGLAPVRRGKRYGLVDATGRAVLAARYTSVSSKWSEGLARIEQFGRSGFVDTTGHVVVAPTFTGATDFSQSLAAVRVNYAWGYIDTTGQLVIPARFDAVRPFAKGLAAVRSREGWGLIDKTGKTVIPTQFYSIGKFTGPIAPARASHAIQRKGEGTYGFIDQTGRWAVPPIFDSVWPAIGDPDDRPAPLLRCVTFRGAQYTVDDFGGLARGGKAIDPDAIAADIFIKETQADDLLVRMGAHRGLGRLATPRAMKALAQTPALHTWQETTAAAQGLEEARPGAGVEYLAAFISGDDAKLEHTALYALLVLCRDPHCERHLRTRYDLLPKKYHLALEMRFGPAGPVPEPDPETPDERTRRRLRSRLPKLDFANVPLPLVIAFLEDVMGVSGTSRHPLDRLGRSGISIDWAALKKAGVTDDTAIRVHASDVLLGGSFREMTLNLPSTVPLSVGIDVDDGGIRMSFTALPTADELIARGKRAKIARERFRRLDARDARDAKAYPKTAKRLNQKLPKLDFANVPLELVIQFMREVSGVPICVDWGALSKVKCLKTTEVNVHLVDVTFRVALRVILDDVGGANDLDYSIANGMVVISTDAGMPTLRQAFASPILLQSAKGTPLAKRLGHVFTGMDMPDVPLSVVLRYVQTKALVPIVVDWDSLKPLGITEQTRTSLEGLRKVPAATVLEILFNSAAGPGAVKLSVKNSVVMVTAAPKCTTQPAPRPAQ